MNYVDANILIYALLDGGTKGAKSRELLAAQKLATSTLSLDEVAFEVGRASKEEAIKAVDFLANSPSIVLFPFAPQDVDSFKEMLGKGMKPRDAIHALTAAKAHASIIYSEDKDFDKLPITRKTPW